MSDSRPTTLTLLNHSLRRRYIVEWLFRAAGLLSVMFGVAAVVFLFYDVISKGYPAFEETTIRLEVSLDAETLGITDPASTEQMARADYEAAIKAALRTRFPDVTTNDTKRKLYSLISGAAAYALRDAVMANPQLLGTKRAFWLLADDTVDMFFKHNLQHRSVEIHLKEAQMQWVDALLSTQDIRKRFNRTFFTASDSREPEQSGIRGALVGSLLTLLVTLSLSFPLGVAAAVYLEEFAPKNRWAALIEVNINNLAAVPSIIFGLLGLAVFINVFGLPRSAPLVGGLVLSLVTLPTIIISGRAAIKAVPPSIREAALGIGASQTQMVMHFVLPLALPGMLTGAIIGMARALGDTAPLLMIGMVAFIVDIPHSLMDSATVLPVQIYLWADSSEQAFTERTSAAIMVLLVFLIVMNTVAVFLRKRLERKW